VKLPQADDTNIMPFIGHNFMKVSADWAGDAAWEHNRDFRTLEWNDIGLEGGGDLINTPDFTMDDGSRSRSVVSRITELNSAAQADGPKLSPQEANDKYGLNGMLTFDNEVTDREAQILYERKLREMKYQLTASQASAWGQAHMFTHGLGSALWDPVNIGITFIPFVGTGASFLNAMHKGYMGFRTLNTLNRVRLAQGFVHASAWTTAFEIPAAYAKHQEQADYTLMDSFYNIAAGGVVGAGFRAGIPRIYGWFTNVPHKRHEAALQVAAAQFAEGKDVNVDAIIRAARNLAKANPDGRILTDIDAASLQRSYNKETGYVPPMLPAPMRLLENEGPTMGELNAKMSPPNWVMADMPLRTQDFDITPAKLGSNDGGMMVHKQTGETWYLKTPKNSEWAANEWIASAIIERLLGQRGPTVRLVYKDGKPHGIASRWKKGERLTPKFLKTMKKRFPKKLRELRETTMVHAWLGNRDWAAPENLIVDRGGNVHSIDAGGSLNFRSKGERKADFNTRVLTEIMTFLNSTNPAIKAIVDDMTPTDFFNAIRKIYQLSNKEIVEIVEGMNGYPGMKEAQIREIISALQARRDSLASMEDWITKINVDEGVEINAKGFPKALQKAWFTNKDGSFNPRGMTDNTAYNKLKKLANIADAYNHTRKEIFPITYSVRKMENWLNSKLKKYYSKLTSEEVDALDFWRKNDPRNGLVELHDFVASVNAGKYLPSKNLKMAKIYESLVSAINKFELDEQITIFSGKSAANFKVLNTALRTIKNDRDLGQIIGKQLNTDSFFNGSFNRATGDMFAMLKSAGTNIEAIKTLKDTSLPVFLEVRIPEGTKMALPNATEFRPKDLIPEQGAKLFEHEVILQPGTPLHIVDARIQNVNRTGANNKIIKSRTVFIKAEVRSEGTPISREAQLSNANWNQYRNHSLATADVKIPKEMVGLNKREEILKVEADPQGKKLNDMTKQVKEITEDYKLLDDQNVNDQITKINNEFNDTSKFNQLLGKAMRAVKNCITGKV